jgi:predicted phage tail protein
MIHLHHGLSRMFEKKYGASAKNINIKARSAQEVIRAMSANFKGFRQLFRKTGGYRIVRGNDVANGTNDIAEHEMKVNFVFSDWHILPTAFGAKGGAGGIMGALMIIVGVVIIAIGVYTENPALIAMGASMAFGGLGIILTPMPPLPKNEGGGGEPGYLFNGAINRAEPGYTVPVIYGTCWAGTVPVSFGIDISTY